MTPNVVAGGLVATVIVGGCGLLPSESDAQEVVSCPGTVIAGRVAHGESFAAPFGPGLIFRLDAATHAQNPQGWTIRITPRSEPGTDYSMVVTPPYRFQNVRYLDTGYGMTAEAAVAWTPRVFSYVERESEYWAATEALDVLLWQGGRSSEDVAAARTALADVPRSEGRLWIEDAGIGPASAAFSHQVIEWLDFRVRLCLSEGDENGRPSVPGRAGRPPDE